MTMAGISFSSNAQGTRESDAEPRGAAKPLTMSQATMPETVVFLLMREIKLADSTEKAVELRNELQTWRGFAHERRRKVNNAWSKPQEFARKREVFAKYLADAQDELKGAKTDTEKKAAQTKANAKILQATRSWQDPLMQTYLTGLANLRAGKPDPAIAQAKDCVQAAPFVPAFQQLYGASLLAKGRALDAASPLASAIQLKADRDSISLLRQALGKVPGTQIKNPVFLHGQEVLKAAEAANPNAKPATVDLARLAPPLPGRAGSGATTAMLPTPAFDRLVFRQSNGVAVSSNTLLVDEMLANAAEIYVRLDADTYVPAKIRPLAPAGKTNPKPLPLALVTVDGYAFTPATGDKSTVFQDGQRAAGSPVGVLREMGAAPRALRGRLDVSKAGVVSFAGELLPGESATAILTPEGHLAGMLLGRTDIAVEHGGPATFVPLSDLLPLLDPLRKGPTTRSTTKGPPPKPVAGNSFTVVGIVTETFEK